MVHDFAGGGGHGRGRRLVNLRIARHIAIPHLPRLHTPRITPSLFESFTGLLEFTMKEEEVVAVSDEIAR